MKFTSQVIAAASGSVGGMTYSRNRYGVYIRTRALPVNPQSANQVVIRNFFSSVAAAWLTITQAQRNGWTTYAANVPRTDPLGQSVFLTGLNWYISTNVLRLQANLTRLDTAPVIFSMASLTQPVATPGPTTTSVAFTNSDLWATQVGGFLSVFLSAPQSPSHAFFKGPYRFAGKILGAATPPTSPQLVTNPYVLVSGQRVFMRFIAVNADGRRSPSLNASALL